MFLWLHRKKLFTIFITVTEVAIVIVTYILFVKIYGIYWYLATKAPRHQDYRIILCYSLFNAWNIEIHKP